MQASILGSFGRALNIETGWSQARPIELRNPRDPNVSSKFQYSRLINLGASNIWSRWCSCSSAQCYCSTVPNTLHLTEQITQWSSVVPLLSTPKIEDGVNCEHLFAFIDLGGRSGGENRKDDRRRILGPIEIWQARSPGPNYGSLSLRRREVFHLLTGSQPLLSLR